MKINSDVSDLLFRLLFCIIFIGLGSEHLFSDQLIQRLMPEWIPFPHAVSIIVGAWLVFWGSFILLGWKLRLAAIALGIFLALVTIFVHVPGLFYYPSYIPIESRWMWDILQRSNLVKNLCLLGVCFHLLHHGVGRYSLESYLENLHNRS